MNGEAPAHDVVFVGTGFDSRVALLSAVDWSGIDLGLYGACGPTCRRSTRWRPFVRAGLVDNARTGALYRKARIGLNLYRGTGGAPAESLNPRAYELAADGVFTVAQPRAEQTERSRGLRGHLHHPRRARGAHPDAPGRRLAPAPHGRGPARPWSAEDTYHHRAAQLVAHLKP